MHEYLIEAARQTEEKVLKRVLRQVLGREVYNEDGRRVTIVKKIGDHNNYALLFDGIHLGWVRKEFEGNRYSVKFEPVKDQSKIGTL